MIGSVDGIVSAIANGKTAQSPWNKQTGAAAYTAGRWYNTFTLGGSPSLGAYSGTSLAAQALTDASAGAMYHGGNVSTDVKHLLSMEAMTAVATGVPAYLMLVDLLLYYPGINMNTGSAQTLTNATTLPRYTSGAGVMGFLEIVTSSGATAHNVALSYTNSGSTSGRALGQTVACTASAITPHITHSGLAANNFGPFLPLAAGDVGIKSVQSLTLSAASLAGTAALVLCKPLAQIPITTVSVASGRDLLFNMPSLPQIQDGACLSYLLFTGGAVGASTNFYGNHQFVWG